MTCILEIITTFATIAALVFAIHQSKLARLALEAAKQSIDEDKRARQISMLPDLYSVIEVDNRISRWLRDLETLKYRTHKATLNQDEKLLKEISLAIPRNPKNITFPIDSFLYKKVPINLREIMMSGAQYFYDAVTPAYYLWTEKDGARWSYAEDIHERYDDSIEALKKLRVLTRDMVPKVILKTPANLADSDFINE